MAQHPAVLGSRGTVARLLLLRLRRRRRLPLLLDTSLPASLLLLRLLSVILLLSACSSGSGGCGPSLVLQLLQQKLRSVQVKIGVPCSTG